MRNLLAALAATAILATSLQAQENYDRFLGRPAAVAADPLPGPSMSLPPQNYVGNQACATCSVPAYNLQTTNNFTQRRGVPGFRWLPRNRGNSGNNQWSGSGPFGGNGVPILRRARRGLGKLFGRGC